MSVITKKEYDAVVSKPRINFGKYRFVEIEENCRIPNFMCCNGLHNLCQQNLESNLEVVTTSKAMETVFFFNILRGDYCKFIFNGLHNN